MFKSDKREEELVCNRCSRSYIYDRGRGHRRKVCNSCNANKNRTDRKIQAVEYKGGKCLLCGYNRCLSSLVFHHVDPITKDFPIQKRHLCRSWEAVKRELEKCVLLCANCHGEVHEGLHLDYINRH